MMIASWQLPVAGQGGTTGLAGHAGLRLVGFLSTRRAMEAAAGIGGRPAVAPPFASASALSAASAIAAALAGCDVSLPALESA